AEDDERQESDNNEDELPMEDLNIQAHNLAMILDPTTNIRRGTRSQPVMAEGSFLFRVDKQITQQCQGSTPSNDELTQV
ncbi:hypothetical protein FRC08_015760, partial [Ceratobasidium sp. 394]